MFGRKAVLQLNWMTSLTRSQCQAISILCKGEHQKLTSEKLSPILRYLNLSKKRIKHSTLYVF